MNLFKAQRADVLVLVCQQTDDQADEFVVRFFRSERRDCPRKAERQANKSTAEQAGLFHGPT